MFLFLSSRARLQQLFLEELFRLFSLPTFTFCLATLLDPHPSLHWVVFSLYLSQFLTNRGSFRVPTALSGSLLYTAQLLLAVACPSQNPRRPLTQCAWRRTRGVSGNGYY